MSKKILNIIGVLVAVILVIIVVGLLVFQTLARLEIIKPPAPDTINAIDIMDKYEENSYNAEELYNDKRFRTTAVVEEIGGDINIVGGIELIVTAEKDGRTEQFYAYFYDDERDKIAKLRVGDKLTFDGTILSGKIWKECRIVK